MKVLDMSSIEPKEKNKIMKEVEIMQSLTHPYIIKISDHYEKKGKYVIVMSYADSIHLK